MQLEHDSKHWTSIEFNDTLIIDALVIECQMLVVDGAEEMNKAQPEKLFDALICPQALLFFDKSTTAQVHCQMDRYSTATELLLDEIARRL